MALPRLLSNGDVLFASLEDARAAYSMYLQRGALAVVTNVPLTPLTPTMVRFTGTGFASPVLARCEVVSQQQERSLLRILEPAPSAFAHLETQTGTAAGEALADAPDTTAAAPSEAPCLGRFLRGDVLAFQHEAEFSRAREIIQRTSRLRARLALPGLSYGRRTIALRVGDEVLPGRVLADLHPGDDGELSLRFAPDAASQRVFTAPRARVAPPSTPPRPAETSSVPAGPEVPPSPREGIPPELTSTDPPPSASPPSSPSVPASAEAPPSSPSAPSAPSAPSVPASGAAPPPASPASPISPTSPSSSTPPATTTTAARLVPAAIDFLDVTAPVSAPPVPAPSSAAPAPSSPGLNTPMGGASAAPSVEAAPSGEAAPDAGGSELKHILAVEDDPTNLRMLTLFLEKSGFLVSGAADGVSALQMLQQGRYDLVLLDVMMPGLSGLEVLEEVRKTKTPVELPVIMVSAMSDSVSVVKAITLGANDYVTKPYEFSILLARMSARLAIDMSRPAVSRTPPPPPEEKARLEAALPHLDGDLLAFPTREDLVAAGKDIKVLRAVRATTAAPQRGMEPRSLRLSAGARASSFRLGAMLNPGPEGTAVIQFDDGKAIDQAFAELTSEGGPVSAVPPAIAPAPSVTPSRASVESAPPPPPRAATPVAPSTSPPAVADRARTSGGRVQLSLSPRGSLRNPSSAADIRGMNVLSQVTEEQQAEPTTHLLLRWLLTTKGTLRVDVQCQGRAAVTFYVVDGNEVRGSMPLTGLGRGLAGATGTYEITQERRPVAQSQRAATLALMQETVRALCGTFSDVQLEEALGDVNSVCPQLNNTGRTLLDKLGLPKPYERVAARRFLGRDPLATLLHEEIGARAVLETIYVLEVSGALDWSGSGATGNSAGLVADDRFRKMAGEYEGKIANANHFEILGLHWSSSLRSIPDAYRDLRKFYGPDGSARATAKDICERVWPRIEEAYETLREPARRQAYRRRVYPLSWSQQVNLMLDRAELAIYRNDLREANDLLLVCKDIEPSPRIEEMLQKLKAEDGKGGG